LFNPTEFPLQARRRHAVPLMIVAMLMLALPAQHALAQSDYPAKPVRYIVATAPGGSNDVLARMVGAKLHEAWGQPVIIDNRGGGGGNIAANMAAKSPPDGYTLLTVSLGHAINVTLYPDLAYDLRKDLAPIIFLASSPLIVCVTASLPIRSINDLVSYAKANPVNYGVGFIGAISHVAVEQFKRQMGVSMNTVPYSGGGPAGTALAVGEVQVVFNPIPDLIALTRTGRVRPIAIASAHRSPLLPDVATMAEQGVKNFEVGNWAGMVAPAGVPPAIVKRLSAEINRILKMPDIREKLIAQGFEAGGGTPEQFNKFLNSEIDRWGKVVTAMGIK
jgi:tripartite-type tricarboxylate transporter receptor subunit TctC